MSKLNPRNFQLNLAFHDTDLGTPEHDEIMHWLSDWVKHESNIRSLIRPSFDAREKAQSHELCEQAINEVSQLPDHKQGWVRSSFQRQHEEVRVKVTKPWPDEPAVNLSYKKSEWEFPLSAERGPIMGFCDLYCEYSVGQILSQETSYTYNVRLSNDASFGERSEFTKISESKMWHQYTTTARLFFEVKTRIPSIGELMRQLQLYRTSPTFRWSPYDGPRSINKFFVVAPPNNEAAAVCAEHGIFFVEYRHE